MTTQPRLARGLAIATVFGFGVAMVEGQADGLRDSVGNVGGGWHHRYD